jgi:predicted transcriptional regulator
MKLPCEVAVRSVVPAIRCLLARELTETHGMSQTEAANLLGITQTAVSKYVHHERGRILLIEKEKEIRTQIERVAISLFHNNMDRTTLALQICGICKLVRKKRLMCNLCKKADPKLNIEHCDLCIFAACTPARKEDL